MKHGDAEKREEHKQHLRTLQQKVRQKINYHLKKPYIDLPEFYHLVREFFLELLGKDYEPTYEEILDELEHIEHEYLSFTAEQRERAQRLLRTLNEIEYSGKPIAQEDIKLVLMEFQDLAVEFSTYEDEHVEQALHAGFVFLKKGQKAKARAAYVRACRLYEALGEDQRAQHAEELSELYKQLQSSSTADR